jgi:hypothetical protein
MTPDMHDIIGCAAYRLGQPATLDARYLDPMAKKKFALECRYTPGDVGPASVASLIVV